MSSLACCKFKMIAISLAALWGENTVDCTTGFGLHDEKMWYNEWKLQCQKELCFKENIR